MVWEGKRRSRVPGLIGATNPQGAAPGTIRGDLALSVEKNLVHGSDSPESARREIGLFLLKASYAATVPRWRTGFTKREKVEESAFLKKVAGLPFNFLNITIIMINDKRAMFLSWGVHFA